ncbi:MULTISPECIES: hypothetical protein [unclassified Novosphingobium]|uniref:hypothetical protein n=1 Tax=unclassified Novosphingobium TaxID=2644732 RepID=UPI000D4A9F43|nr:MULTISPECIES: hypothetical protein [unclassified Novosphingobium]PTR06036.1 hypothetical protein C8K11_12343 [Novosphingobium sp. GV055]PUA94542.1 hypothetical protein C8K12_12343 [Novosphingobium sp. GV061]PUB13079.1 hypothetical protein C8K14_12343 [Novosphingobium sp. GV079]PUB38197.1 hypothetical protein C8K10_12343 [Novosphingobium sp. GV027]
MTAKARVAQADIERAVRAAIRAGMDVGSVQVSAGGDIVIYAKGESRVPPPATANPLDRLL